MKEMYYIWYSLQHTLTENSTTENPLITSPTKTTLIHKALKKLMNGHTPSVNDDITDNNNEEVTESDGIIAEVEVQSCNEDSSKILRIYYWGEGIVKESIIEGKE